MRRIPSWILRLFLLTKREYFADFFITPPLTAVLAWHSLSHNASWLWPIQFVAGWLAWTLYEYALHRWALHEWPIGRQIHALHHANQRDYVAIHPIATILIYVAVWLVFGLQASGFAVGLSAGYIAYAVLHSAFHYADLGPGHPLYAGRERHAAHHRFGSVNFGVTTRAWDRVFGTTAYDQTTPSG